MRGIYKNKHDCLVNALKQFGSRISIFGESAGLHLLVQYHGEKKKEELLLLAKSQGIRVYPLADYQLEEGQGEPIFILGFARLSEEEIEKGISILRDIW